MFSRSSSSAEPQGLGRKISSMAGSTGNKLSDIASRQSQNTGWIMATFFALILGFLVGLIVAPRSGQETREKIGERAKGVTNIVTRRQLKESSGLAENTDELP